MIKEQNNPNIYVAILFQIFLYPFSGGFVYLGHYMLGMLYALFMWMFFILMLTTAKNNEFLLVLGAFGLTITFFASLIHIGKIVNTVSYVNKTYFYRIKENKLLGGILASFANKLGWNPWVLRIGAFFLFFIGDGRFGGIFILFYLIFWAVLPLGKPENNLPPAPNFKVKLPLNKDESVEVETHYEPDEEFVVDCPYCSVEQTILVNHLDKVELDKGNSIEYICSNCKKEFDFTDDEKIIENEIKLKYDDKRNKLQKKLEEKYSQQLKKEIEELDLNYYNQYNEKVIERKNSLNNIQLQYEIYLKELKKFDKSQTNFIVKNYILFCFEEFGENFNLSFLTRYFKEELDKNLPESLLKNQLNLIKKEHKEVKKKYTMAEIDSMDGIVFEGLVKELLDKMSYTNVRVTSKSRDGGVDVVAHKDGLKYIIQAKRYQASKTLGNKAVQEIISGKKRHDANKLMVMTTAGKFSVDAKRMARDNSVELVDRIKLKKMLMEVDLI